MHYSSILECSQICLVNESLAVATLAEPNMHLLLDRVRTANGFIPDIGDVALSLKLICVTTIFTKDIDLYVND
jgi:hypothetical protein